MISEEAWPADERADAGEHFFDMEGLGHIVVGAGIDTGNLVAPPVAGSQDQNRHRAAGAAPFFEHRDAVQFGQANVEDDGVIGFGIAEEVSLLTVERLIDDIARLFQRVAQLPVQIDVVFDYQNAHRFAFIRCKSLMS